MSETAIEIKNLRTYFKTENGDIPAIDDVSWSIKKGSILGLVGESGSGKSMTALSILRLVPEPFGKIMEGSRIMLGDIDILALSEKEMAKIRGNKIAMIFQEPMTSLNPVQTIGKQMMEPFFIHTATSKEEAKKLAIQTMKDIRIPDPEKRFKQYPHQLSGGLRQRVMIAMAMCLEPMLLIADEPTTALDVTIQAQIITLMKDLQKKTGTSILYISHDLGIVAELCDEICVMYAGKIIEKADVFELFKNPQHPYTIGLLKSIPKVNEDITELYSIKGMVPNLTKLPKGCNFAPRCDTASPKCFEVPPPTVEKGNGHIVSCHFCKESGELN